MKSRDTKKRADKIASKSTGQAGSLPYHRSPDQAVDQKLQADMAQRTAEQAMNQKEKHYPNSNA